MKQHQLVAVLTGRKPQVLRTITDIYQKLGNEAAFNGLYREYAPINEEGEVLPSETKNTTNDVAAMITEFSEAMAPLMDLVASQDATNQKATGSVCTDDGILTMTDVPATTLIYLEKQLTDVRTFIGKLPTLTPTRTWTWDEDNERYRSSPEKTVRTKKVLRNHVKAEATEHHPAQVEVYTEDVQEGHWTKTEYSTAIPASRKKEMTDRVNSLIEAVKVAREAANEIETQSLEIGQIILEYVFKGE